MEKRLPLALFLSFLVLFGWTLMNPPEDQPEPVPGEETELPAPSTGDSTVPTAETPAQPAAPAPDVADEEERTHEVVVGRSGEPGHYRLLFSNRGARLTELYLGDYFRQVGLSEEQRADVLNWLPLVESLDTLDGSTGSLLLETAPSSRALVPGGLSRALWRMEVPAGDAPGVDFTYAPGTGVVFTKSIRALPGSWRLELELGIENLGSGEVGRRDFVLTPAGCVPAELGDRFYSEPQAVAAGRDGDEIELDSVSAAGADSEGGTLDVPLPPLYAGVHNKYFAFLLRTADAAQGTSLLGARYAPVVPLVPQLGPNGAKDFVTTQVPLALEVPPVGERRTWRFLVYAGPKDRAEMVEDYEPHAAVLDEDLSTFATIGRLLLSILGLFHKLTGNWGVAIILLTVCVRAALFPLNRRSQTSMARYQKKMKRVQPKLDEIKKKFANDSQKQREAQARIMQEEGAFPPLGGCLPVFVQLPIFFGLFSALRTSFDLRQAPFASWIDDLSRPDRLLELDMAIPLGFTTFDLSYLNLLPILMVVLWILQQKGMPKPSDEQQARMQKMMMFMPILFGFMLYNYAAGLSLYMITGSGLGIIEQRVIKKLWPIDDTEPETKKKKRGCGPFAGMLENMAEKQRTQMKAIESMKKSGKQTKRPKRRR